MHSRRHGLHVCNSVCSARTTATAFVRYKSHAHAALLHATQLRPLLTGKSRNSLGVLNATQEKHFKRRRLDGLHMAREEFMQNPNFSSREKRLLARGLE